MKVRSWLSACSSSVCISTADDTHTAPPPETSRMSPTPCRFLLSDTTSSSSNSQDSTCTNTSLESNLSLLTLPSVPSLQKLSPENLNISITTQCLTSVRPHPSHVNFLAVHNNLLYAISGNQINAFHIIRFDLFDTFSVQDPSSSSIKSLVFHNGKIFSAHQDCKIRAWKLTPNNKHKLIATLPTLEDRLRNFILPKNYVKIRRHKKKLWVEHYDAISGLAVVGDWIYSVSWDKYLKIWRAPDFRCVESIKAHDDAINAVAASADGLVYTGSADKRIKVWRKTFEEKKYVLIATLEKHKSAVNALALSSDGSVLFSGACDRSILVWEREDSANHMVVTGALRGHSKAILCLVNDSVSDLLFSGSADRTVRIWQRRPDDGRYCCLTALEGHDKPVKSLVAVPESRESGGEIKVISGSFDGEIKVWKVMISSIMKKS